MGLNKTSLNCPRREVRFFVCVCLCVCVENPLIGNVGKTLLCYQN